MAAKSDIKLEGLEETRKALAQFGIDADMVIAEGVEAIATNVQGRAVRKIQRGPATGRTYGPITGKRSKPHQASAPGEPPMSDSGRLATSIRMVTDGLESEVGTDLKYGGMLEFGTRDIEPRPWLVPSLEEERRKSGLILAQAVRRAIERAGERG